MQPKKRYGLLLSVLTSSLIFSSCHFNSTYLNRDSDIEDGKNFINNFYADSSLGLKNDIVKLESDTLKQLAGKKGLQDLIDSTRAKLGDYKDYTVTESETQAIKGTDAATIYRFRLNVIYSRGKADEMFLMKKVGSDPIKLYGYHINSNAFAK